MRKIPLHHFVILTQIVSLVNCCDLEQFFSERQVSVEESAATSQIVFRGFTIASQASSNDVRGVFTAYFELINTYKGAEALEIWGADNNRRINVTFLTRPSGDCSEGSEIPREYIIFCNLVSDELRATSIAKWDESADERVWAALGGIMTEPLSNLGANVVGLDPGNELINIAKERAQTFNLEHVQYLCSSIEEHVLENREKYDVVTVMETVEHVKEQPLFIKFCVECLKPGGSIFIMTESKTRISEFIFVTLCEDVFKSFPKGTHTYSNFIAAEDMVKLLQKGWSSWSDWSACSVSCSSGIQQRIRHCLLAECPGFNVEQRHCNLFGCDETVNPLAIEESRFFHPSKDRWETVPNRPTAWRLKPNSYIWVPSIQLFPDAKIRPFPTEFALFVTLRVQNQSTMGTIFSLRSRRRQDTYLSLEIAGIDLKLIHAASNGTDVVRIPTQLGDGKWHQIALSIRDDSVVDSYVDCEWSRTDILRSHTLDIPDDSDLIIGYLFTGDLEQLSIVPDPRLVSLQCSSLRTPIIDPTVKEANQEVPTTQSMKLSKKKRFKQIKIKQ